MSKNEMKHQEERVLILRNGAGEAYNDASIYTILFDLVSGNGMEDVVAMLHNLAFDLGEREELEKEFDKAKGFEWKEVQDE